MEVLIYMISTVMLACIGSFIGVCCERLPRNEQVLKGKSQCDSCGNALRAPELIPVISYLVLRGRCGRCKAKITAFCVLIELATIAFGLLPLIMIGLTVQGFAYSAATCILIEIAVMDYKTMEISDLANIMIAMIGLVLMFVNGSYTSSLIGMICVSFPFLILALFKAMGWGDVKLMAAVGILLGIQGVLLAAFFGIIVGSIAAMFMKLKKLRGWKSEMAFGPFLCVGAYAAMLFGPKCISLYLSLF